MVRSVLFILFCVRVGFPHASGFPNLLRTVVAVRKIWTINLVMGRDGPCQEKPRPGGPAQIKKF